MIKKIIFLGPPGSGKGTLASKIEEQKKIKHISTGDIFRTEIKSETKIGIKIKKILNKGKYVSDDITNKIVKEALIKNSVQKKGYLLDGYPRTKKQAQFLEKWDLGPQKAILLNISDNSVIQRLLGRLFCPRCKKNYHKKTLRPQQKGICDKDATKLISRLDDKPELIKKRVEIYKEQTKILTDFYEKKGILYTVNADNTPEVIYKNIERELF